MIKSIRYTLAALCLAASVGCLALWWRSYTVRDDLFLPNNISPRHVINFTSSYGSMAAKLHEAPRYSGDWTYFSSPTESSESSSGLELEPHLAGNFGRAIGTKAIIFYWPHWYPALIFALAGVGVLRFRRQFSIRSALICFTVVAALLGMAVVL